MKYKIGDIVVVKEQCLAQSRYSEWDMLFLNPGEFGEVIAEDTAVFNNGTCVIRISSNSLRPLTKLERALK